MNKADILILENRIKNEDDNAICCVFIHDIDKCGKYSAVKTYIKVPVMNDLAEKLTHYKYNSKFRCIRCKKFVKKISDIKFLIRKDVTQYLIDKSNFTTLQDGCY